MSSPTPKPPKIIYPPNRTPETAAASREQRLRRDLAAARAKIRQLEERLAAANARAQTWKLNFSGMKHHVGDSLERILEILEASDTRETKGDDR